MSKLVVLGSVNADHVLKVPSFPRPGETLHGGGYQVIPGGKGANQAVAAARLGADISFIACVGDDAFGKEMKQSFQATGIGTSAVMEEQGTPTGIAMIQVADTGENSICISAEANGKLDAERLKPHLSLIESAEYLLMQLETPMCGVELAAKAAKASGTTVVLNPAPATALSDQLLSCVDIITPNETEAELLTGVTVFDERSAQLAADILHAKGITIVMITLGAEGVWLSVKEKGTAKTGNDDIVYQQNNSYQQDNSHQKESGKVIKGFRVNAIDTTAAGDTFNGALLTGLLEGMALEEAIEFSHAAAAISVTRFGAQTSIPNRDEADRFLQQQMNN